VSPRRADDERGHGVGDRVAGRRHRQLSPVSDDEHDRTVPVEAWIDGRKGKVVFVVHRDQITIVSGENRTIEIHAPVWRLAAMRIVILMARLTAVRR
jgi:hypothetical protein